MRLPSYLIKNRHGIYRLRLYVPKPLQPVFKTAEIRRSLGTRDPREAREAGYRLAPALRRFWHMSKKSPFDPVDLHTAFSEIIGTVKKIRIELGQGGAFEFDTLSSIGCP